MAFVLWLKWIDIGDDTEARSQPMWDSASALYSCVAQPVEVTVLFALRKTIHLNMRLQNGLKCFWNHCHVHQYAALSNESIMLATCESHTKKHFTKDQYKASVSNMEPAFLDYHFMGSSITTLRAQFSSLLSHIYTVYKSFFFKIETHLVVYYEAYTLMMP